MVQLSNELTFPARLIPHAAVTQTAATVAFIYSSGMVKVYGLPRDAAVPDCTLEPFNVTWAAALVWSGRVARVAGPTA